MIIKIIQLLHLILVILLVGSVFIQNYQLKKYAFTFLIFIFIQYITNYGKCGLTELEYIFKIILGSFNKKRKKPIGIFTENTVKLFNLFIVVL